MPREVMGLLNEVFDETIGALRTTGASTAANTFYPAASLTTIAGTPTLVVTNAVSRLTLPDAATTTIGLNFQLPSWWNSFTVHLYWTAEAGTGAVRWQGDVKKLDIGVDLISEAVFATTATNVTAPTALTPTIHALQNVTMGAPGGFGTMWSLQISRIGADGGDTLAAAAAVFGIQFVRLT